ncbi:hypothetical protein CCACVL1_23041 [Corchorus capsularis]|uniref:Uncharacterized protein n=1 Tax=Corchorus capsularis TaxID=210143 RepID=A0A1R3GVE8_COCAP|nr:hypothetical protein CCACVL1_23041 [Corchorus capsularis]
MGGEKNAELTRKNLFSMPVITCSLIICISILFPLA